MRAFDERFFTLLPPPMPKIASPPLVFYHPEDWFAIREELGAESVSLKLLRSFAKPYLNDETLHSVTYSPRPSPDGVCAHPYALRIATKYELQVRMGSFRLRLTFILSQVETPAISADWVGLMALRRRQGGVPESAPLGWQV